MASVSVDIQSLKGESKTARVRDFTPEPTRERLPKPPWIRTRVQNSQTVTDLKNVLRRHQLNTVCEEASCPNLNECFGHGTATFMIMGQICTRRCPFCDVAHGRPQPLNENEPAALAETIAAMRLRYVVITSVDRDDLRDGGGAHFAACIQAIRDKNTGIIIEILVPDFRGRMDVALDTLSVAPPDVFNHNLETVPRLYKRARPGADYQHSLRLIQAFKAQHPLVPTKSGLMVGLGETIDEVITVMKDLRAHDCDRLTIGQYLQPGKYHLPVERFWTPAEFALLKQQAVTIGFSHVASGPMVRSSYHADLQARGDDIH